MEIQSDFKELLELFNANKVEYMIVGGYALAFHGAPRFTGDIDLFVSSDRENAKRYISSASNLLNYQKKISRIPTKLFSLVYHPFVST